jgi:hypothetical protein
MAAQRLVAARLILPRIVVEIAEGGGQAVAAMLQRRSASATKLSPPSTTWACSQPEKASRK